MQVGVILTALEEPLGFRRKANLCWHNWLLELRFLDGLIPYMVQMKKNSQMKHAYAYSSPLLLMRTTDVFSTYFIYWTIVIWVWNVDHA